MAAPGISPLCFHGLLRVYSPVCFHGKFFHLVSSSDPNLLLTRVQLCTSSFPVENSRKNDLFFRRSKLQSHSWNFTMNPEKKKEKERAGKSTKQHRLNIQKSTQRMLLSVLFFPLRRRARFKVLWTGFAPFVLQTVFTLAFSFFSQNFFRF